MQECIRFMLPDYKCQVSRTAQSVGTWRLNYFFSLQCLQYVFAKSSIKVVLRVRSQCLLQIIKSKE